MSKFFVRITINKLTDLDGSNEIWKAYKEGPFSDLKDARGFILEEMLKGKFPYSEQFYVEDGNASKSVLTQNGEIHAVYEVFQK